jgi:AbiV family abortive infection protein
MNMSDEQKNEFDKWVASADEDWQTAEILLNKKRFVPALFFVHLSLEKLIKALIIKQNIAVPLSHDLEYLYSKIADVPEKYELWLREITGFNVEARYDIDKLKLYKKATANYTIGWFDNAKKVKQWLKQ